ncbi:MAG: NAD(P)-binding protein [Gemmatimonadaceae bacterium]
MTGVKRPIRVAVIGGGCASLTTAFELTRPELAGQYDVTVYQMGWRLGGKGASGRGVNDRIEEHGLHLWMGFYENAFRLMRDCYAALPIDAGRRFTNWQDAFTPAPDVAVANRMANGGWEFWRAHFPAGRGLPGDPLDESSPFTVRGYLRQSALLIGELLRSAQDVESARGVPSADTLLRYGQLAGAAALFEASDTLRQAIDVWLPQMLLGPSVVLVRLIESFAAAARRQLEMIVAGDGELRRIWHVIDLILAILRGAALNGMALDARGFDAINGYDWREWLRMNGASGESLDSGFMRGIYDLAFAFEDGDVNKPRLAAGVALRGAMRMFFTYRGSLFWRMSAGMGDVVFSPLYEVLKERGVTFEFFHRLRDVRLAPARKGETPFVQSLEFDVQAKVKGGGEYQPLVDVQGVPCWPSAPDYSQLLQGAKLERDGRSFEAHHETRRAAAKTLRVEQDFDYVVLGVSIGAIPYVASELVARDPRWAAMVRHVKSVPTQAMQVWLGESMGEVGWPHPPSNVSGFVEPFDTWADMGHLIPEERWNGRVKSIAYFCSVLPDVAPPDGELTERFVSEQRALVRANAIRFLNRDVGALWPNAVNEQGFRWGLLVSSERRNGVDKQRRFDSQYWSANVNPSDRYVLSLPGSLEYRLSPLDMCFDNLTIAGDWTATGLDTGCIESAVMSGRLAAHSLSQFPPLEDIVGYDHP